MLAPNHKRILRNTGMLYIRMLFAMVVTLYTSRVVLDVLGIEDFGIYHVVAGFVALLGFLHGAMTSATQRYFAFDLGKSKGSNLSQIFSTSVIIHGLLALLIVLVAETAGYWFVSTHLIIPLDRVGAGLWAYHLAVFSFATSVIMVPFTAMLTAHEKMGVFASIGILDVLLKLGAVILLKYFGEDKLVTYACLMLAVALTTFTLYAASNRILFPAVRLQKRWHGEQFRHMASYTAWNTWGNLAAALSTQGTNVLLNIFFGPAVNAGRSIATQANGALTNFIINVQAAINPQIIKLYASGERAQMHAMVLYASKYNFFLLFTLALPVLLYTEPLMNLWLVEIPPYAVIFLQLTITASLIDSFSGPLMTSAQATGRIRLYQTVVGGVLLLNVPGSFLFLQQGYPPETVLSVSLALCVVALVARLMIISPLIRLPIRMFLSKVMVRAVMVVVVASLGASRLLPLDVSSGFILLRSLVITVVVSLIVVWLLGLGKPEKKQLFQLVKNIGARFG